MAERVVGNGSFGIGFQSRSGDTSESFGSFDDDLSGFDQRITSMLSVRGNCIMSWVGDDDFVVDDKSSVGYEATFFSLDLHALAAQLEKIDVSKRLFIGADLLPPELYAEESREEGTCTSVEAERNMHGNGSNCGRWKWNRNRSYYCDNYWRSKWPTKTSITISYMAERVVGNGSFGIGFQAKCLEMGETVAIKRVLQDESADATDSRYNKEVKFSYPKKRGRVLW